MTVSTGVRGSSSTSSSTIVGRAPLMPRDWPLAATVGDRILVSGGSGPDDGHFDDGELVSDGWVWTVETPD